MKPFNELKHSNKGASLVLVSAFCLIVLGIAVTLTILASLLMSNAEHRKHQDQAFELATSLSSRVEELILNESVNLSGSTIKSSLDLQYIIDEKSGIIVDHQNTFSGIPDSHVTAVVTIAEDAGHNTYYVLTVTAESAGEKYIKVTEYNGSANQGYSRR